jgi:SAM-dependent methyltransferase
MSLETEHPQVVNGNGKAATAKSAAAPKVEKPEASNAAATSPDPNVVMGTYLVPGRPLTPEALAYYYDQNVLEAKENYDANDWADPEQMYSQFDFFLSRVDLNGKTLLDVGTGNGLFFEYLQKKGIKPAAITAIDISEEQIKVVKKRFPEVDAVAFDFFKYEFEESYDYVTLFGVAPCLKFIFPQKHRVSALLRLMERSLRYAKEGVAISFLNRNCYEMCEIENYEYTYFYPEEFCSLLSGAKYEISTVDNDLVSNCFIHVRDAWDMPFRFNMNRLDDALNILK